MFYAQLKCLLNWKMLTKCLKIFFVLEKIENKIFGKKFNLNELISGGEDFIQNAKLFRKIRK